MTIVPLERSPPSLDQVPVEPELLPPPRRSRRAGLLLSFARHHRAWTLAILALAALNLLWRLDRTWLTDADEAHYGVVAYGMLRQGSWVRTAYAGATDFFNLKPVLGYWMIELSYLAVGCNRLALRLPSALCDLACIAATILLARRFVGRAGAVIAGMLLAATFPFIMQHTGRTGDLDAPLALIITGAAFAAWSLRGALRLHVVSLLFMLGFLLKSFAIGPSAAAIAVFLATSVWRSGMRHPFRHLACAGLLFVLPIALWAIARYQADGSAEFLRRMAAEDSVLRYCTNIDNRSYGPFCHVASLFYRGNGMAALALIGLAIAWTGGIRPAEVWQRPRARFLALLILVPIAIFSCAVTRHKWYVNPVYPFLAIAAGWAALRAARGAFPLRLLASAVGACSLIAGEWNIVGNILEHSGPAPEDEIRAIALDPVAADRAIHLVASDSAIELFAVEVMARHAARMVPEVECRRLAKGSLLLLPLRHPLDLPPVRIVARGESYALYEF